MIFQKESELVRLGLVGCGSWGPRYCRSVAKLKNVQLIGVTDIVQERAVEISQKTPGCQVFESVEAMFDCEFIDGVIVVTPTPTHYALVMQALDAKKHVLVEKPIAVNLQEALEMAKKAKMAERGLMVGQIVRFIPTMSRAREIVQSGKIGRVLHVSERRYGRFRTDAWPTWWTEMEGFLLLHLGSHSIDVILWILNRKPLWAFAQGFARRVDSRHNAVDAFSLTIGLEEEILTTIDHEAYGGRPDLAYELLIVGEEGTIRMDGFNKLLLDEKSILDVEGDFFAEALQAEVIEFAASIRENRTPLVSGWDVIQTVAVLDAGRKSLRTCMMEPVVLRQSG